MFCSIRSVGETRTRLRSLALGLVMAVAGLTGLAAPAAAQDPIRLGGEVQGRFQDGDAQLTSGEYVDVYVFEGRAGQQVTVQMSSEGVAADRASPGQRPVPHPGHHLRAR